MAFSNSFHSSAKKHSIGSSKKLADVEAHNEREYTSARYKPEKTQLIQGEYGLSLNVQNAINDIFAEHIREYNRKQKRKDRRILDDPFDYFCGNKKLDIAAEAIYQIGDQEFWARWRTDEVVGHRKGKDIVAHTYPPEVMAVMSGIYRRQMDAYEAIYETHGKEILAKIELHYSRCQDTLDRFRRSLDYDRFADIAETKPKARKLKIQQLTDDERAAYTEFSDAYYSAKDIEDRQYRERIIKGQMHIRNIQGMGHYDEASPHAHGISILWADGYRNGLSSRVAKAVVLNRFALETIQDRLHEIAQEEIAKHPEIFGEEKLKETEEGRNLDYTTEQIIRQNQARLMAENAAAERRAAELKEEIGAAERRADFENRLADIEADRAAASRQEEAELRQQIAADRDELSELCKIKSMAERDQLASVAWAEMDELQSAIDMVDDFCEAATDDMDCGGLNLQNLVRDFIFDWQRIRDRIGDLVESIKEKIRSIGLFEWIQKVRPENQVAGILQENLDQTLASTKGGAGALAQHPNEREHGH